jgi:subtilisin family serine protease
MIACKRGRISLASVFIVLVVIYLLVFSFPSKFTGLFIKNNGLHISDTEISSVIQQIEDNNEASVIVMLKNPDLSIQSDVISILSNEDFKLKYNYNSVNAFSGTLTKSGLEKLQNDERIEMIYLDRKFNVTLNDSIPIINANDVWPMQLNGINITGKGQTVCVIDTGINYSHVNLGGGWGNKVLDGYDFVNNDTDPYDDQGHGTHVAGIVASTDSVYRGVAPDANLIAIKACDSGGNCDESAFSAGIDWCVGNATKYNISVITLSIGGGAYSSHSECDPYLAAQEISVARGKNIIVTVASGNEYYADAIAYPACASNATSVGATDKTDHITMYSNIAEILDMVAPGGDSNGQIRSTSMSGGFTQKSGTSMATPHVAGAAALLYQYEKLLNNKNATAQEVEELLKKGGKPITDTYTGLTFPRTDILASITAVLKINTTENSIADTNNKVKLSFNSATDFTNASEAFDVGYNYISLNSSKYPGFNKSANITFYNLNFGKTPVILKDGIVCSDCSIISYNKNLTFNIQHFTNYSSGVNSQMTVWDSSDSGMPFYSGKTTSGTNQNVGFYANYTNRTSNSLISNASCNITFDDMSSLIWFNSTKNIFEFIRNFSSTGQKSYNILCNHTSFETINLSDFVWISNCVYPGPNLNWIVNETTGNVYCKSETLLINSTNITVKDGYSLTLENTNLTLIAVSNYINISANANFSSKNSSLNGQLGNQISIYNSGILNISGSTLTYARLYVDGNKTNYIASSTFYDQVYFRQNSTNYISNSYLNSLAQFQDSSNSIISACLLAGSGNVYFRGNSAVNFTPTVTNITQNVYFYNTPTIFGNVNFSSAQISIGNVTRYYPVQVRYNGTGNGIANKSVNITNNLGILIWNSTTDSNGWLTANLTFNTTNYGNGNFTISANPSMNISLVTSTPVIFDINDSNAPTWSNNLTSPPSGPVYNYSQSYQFNISWTDNNALSTVWFENNFSGILKNDSYSGNSGSTYYLNYQGLAAGNYQWRSYANDSSGNLNKTDLWIYTINKAPGQVSLLLNGTSGNLNLTYGGQINASASTQYGNFTLYRNGANVTAAENNVYVLLGVGYYNYTGVSTGNQNYSQADITRFVNITKASSSINLTLNGIDNNLTVNTNDNVNVNATMINPSSGSVELYVNGTKINSGNDSLKNSTSFSAAGTYNITAYYLGNNNYSSSSHTHFITVQTASSPPPSDGGSGGGGGGGFYTPSNQTAEKPSIPLNETCTSDWLCSEWTNCSWGKQTRECIDMKSCKAGKTEEKACELLAAETKKTISGTWLLFLLAIPLILFIIAMLYYFQTKENKLERLIKKANRAIKSRNFEKARKIYRKIHKIYMKLSLEEKKKYHARIEEIYYRIKRHEKIRPRT